MAWPPFYTEASRAIPNFLVPILGDDRSACASCHRWGRTAGNYRLACTARKILCRLSHAGGNLRSLLALRGYRVDLSVSAALSDQSLFMNANTSALINTPLQRGEATRRGLLN